MSQNIDGILAELKKHVDNDDLDSLRYQVEHSIISDTTLPLDFLYQKLYLHACLKKRTRIVHYLRPLYDFLRPIEKIALRQMFSYGDYLLRK